MLYRQEKVKRGMELLDARRPGWDGRLDLDTLNIASASECVLGQEYGSYILGLLDLGLGNFHDYFSATVLENPAAAHGFAGPDQVALTETWKTLVRERHESAITEPTERQELVLV